MSVLDTFYILFKSDAKEVEDGTKKAKGAVDDLESGIGGADKATIQLGKKFNTLAAKGVAAFAAVFSVTQLIASARGIAEQSSALGVLSDVVGESSAEIVNWGRAVENMGGDAKAFEGSLRSLSGNLNDALINGPNAATDALAKMGVSGRDAQGNMRTVLEILPDLAREFSGLTRESAIARGKSLGLDEGTILLLMEGEKAVRALVARQRELNPVSDEQIENLRILNVKWNEFKNSLGDSSTEILSSLLPSLEKVEKGILVFVDLIRDNQDMIMTFFKGAGMLLAALAIKALILASPFILAVAAVGALIFGIGLLPDALRSVGDFFTNMFEGAKAKASGLFDRLKEGYQDLTTSDIGGVQNQMMIMGHTPLTAIGAQASAGAVGNTSNRTNSVSVGEINIETQATDAEGIAASLSSELRTQFSNAINESDDGIAA